MENLHETMTAHNFTIEPCKTHVLLNVANEVFEYTIETVASKTLSRCLILHM